MAKIQGKSKVSNVFEAFYIGYMCLALVIYKAHITTETHVKMFAAILIPYLNSF